MLILAGVRIKGKPVPLAVDGRNLEFLEKILGEWEYPSKSEIKENVTLQDAPLSCTLSCTWIQ